MNHITCTVRNRTSASLLLEVCANTHAAHRFNFTDDLNLSTIFYVIIETIIDDGIFVIQSSDVCTAVKVD